MTNEEFYDLAKKVMKTELEIMMSKGGDYTRNTGDKLYNFKSIAEDLKIDPLVVWFVYFRKHLDALITFMKGQYHDSEPIETRIYDLRNYLLLLLALIKEQNIVKLTIDTDHEDNIHRQQQQSNEIASSPKTIDGHVKSILDDVFRGL